MANIKSAKKQAKQNKVRRKRNLARQTDVKTAVKKVLTALDKKEDAAKVDALFRVAEAKIARAAGKGLIHKKTASRKVSRLAKRIAVFTKPAAAAKA